ncbi:hypothetical protein LCGC14_0560100 [marine sediment metagenome]|uniref:Uncharacterized protein n=1 Tax=marine sediment metagenome TaxID=412755 RepID=A0A0F9UVH2_9ZZZZ
MNKLGENKEKYKTTILSSFRNSVMPLTERDHDVWNFMKKASIESMTYKSNSKAICIKLNSVTFRDK